MHTCLYAYILSIIGMHEINNTEIIAENAWKMLKKYQTISMSDGLMDGGARDGVKRSTALTDWDSLRWKENIMVPIPTPQ